MKLKHPFTEETRNLYLYQHSCMDCGRSDRGLELHHITGRKSNSKLNAIVLCGDCHSKCCHSREEEEKYAKTAIRFHVKEKNAFTPEDLEFYQNNVLLY